MTPQDKAMELILRYYELIPMNTISFAKQCALIAVDEILEELLECGEVWMKSRIKYWQEVKKEIENI